MSAFPTSIPTATTSQTTDTLAAAGHTALHNNLSGEVTAIATKLGAGSSVPAANTVLHGGVAGSSWSTVDVANDVSGVMATSHGGTGTTSSSGTGSVVYNNNPTLVSPTLTGGPSLQGGGVWGGGPTINQPTITDFTNSNHNHSNAAGGGLLSNPYKFSVYRATNQTQTQNAYSKVSLDTVEFDTGSNFDAVTNFRFTAPVSGYYQFSGQVTVDSGLNNHVGTLGLYKNGSLVKEGDYQAGTSVNAAFNVSSLLQLTASDYIELWVYNSNGGTTVQTAGGSTVSYLSGFLVSS